MSLKGLLILLVIIILAVAIAAGATFLYFVWQETMPKLTPTTKSDEQTVAGEPLFPTGETQKPEPPAGQPGTTTEEELVVKKPTLVPLVKLATKPVAGFFMLGSGTSTQVVFADRASGHLYVIRPSEGINPVRVSNTTIPKIYELYGGQSGQEIKIIARYLKGGLPQNFSTGLPQDQPAGAEPAVLEGKFLSSQIYSLVVAPAQDKIFYLDRTGNETQGIIADFDGGKKTIVFDSPFNEWLTSWPDASTIALQSKTTSDIPGSLYFLDIKNKTPTKIISNVPGLTTLVSPDRKKVAYSAQWQKELVFGVYDIKERLFGRLPFRTLADKCTWSKSGSLYCAAPADLPLAAYPEDWYSGEVSSNDRFWKVGSENYRAQLLFDPQLAGFNEAIDATSLSVDADESFLLFLNKKDLNLWLLNLKEGF